MTEGCLFGLAYRYLPCVWHEFDANMGAQDLRKLVI